MAQNEILNSLKVMLDEDKWSKFQLSKYSVKKFKIIDSALEKIDTPELKAEIDKISKEHLEKNEFNVVARYILAIMNYDKKKEQFYSYFENIINNFKEREKWGIAEYLCKRMLQLEVNEYALSSLIESLRHLNKTQDIPELQTKLLKLNPEDTVTALSLAKSNEQSKNIDEAIYYYKQALKVFINQKNNKMVEDIWLKLVEMVDPKNISILLELENGLKTNFEPDFISMLLSSLLHGLMKIKDYDTTIKLLKEMLNYSPKNREYRDKLIEVYLLKYKDHSRLDDFLKSSGLKMWWKDVHKAIELFEKQINFDVGVYVYHHSWGTGRVVEVNCENIQIDFASNPEHKMSFDMALSTLQILAPEHIKVKKRYNFEKIKSIAEEEPVKFIEMVIKSYPEMEIYVDDLKDEVVENIITPKDWMKWWNRAKKELKTNPNFKFIDSEKKIKYVESEKTFGEIITNNFSKAENFFDKIKIAYELIENDVYRKVDIKVYQYITDWFIENLKSNLKLNPAYSYISCIVINNLTQAHTDISKASLNINAEDIINSVSSIPELFKSVNITDYQKILIQDIVKYRENWDKILYQILLLENSRIFDYIYEIFIQKGKEDITEKIIEEAVNNYRSYPELFLWVAKNILTEDWKEVLKNKNEEYKDNILEATFFLLSYLGRQIKNKINIELNTKIQKNIIRLLFDKNTMIFLNYIKHSVEKGRDISSILQLFRENEYIPTRHRENIIAELRSFEKPIVA